MTLAAPDVRVSLSPGIKESPHCGQTAEGSGTKVKASEILVTEIRAVRESATLAAGYLERHRVCDHSSDSAPCGLR